MDIIYYSLFILGTIVGSFVNVLIYRLPRNEGFVKGRSKCSHCHEILKWYDLIPLLSFLVLQAKCRDCGKKISWSYFWVELYSGVVFLMSFIYLYSFGAVYVLAVIFLMEILLILMMTDLKSLILPDSVIIAGVVGVLLSHRVFNSISSGHLFTAAVFFLLFSSIWYLSKGRWLGLGDGKLMILVGLAFGAVVSVAILYLAIILGTMVALILLAFKKANLKTQLPLGSFICFSATVYIFVSYFGGYDIISSIGSIGLILNILK
jgi:leader peptidase (prepilin peptidase) / N-methyltransferase